MKRKLIAVMIATAALLGGAAAAAQAADSGEATAKPFIARVDGRRPPMKGETVFIKPQEGHLHVFNAETGRRIGD